MSLAYVAAKGFAAVTIEEKVMFQDEEIEKVQKEDWPKIVAFVVVMIFVAGSVLMIASLIAWRMGL